MISFLNYKPLSNDRVILNRQDAIIEYLCIDSREIIIPSASCFIALKGNVNNGHKFIDQVYKLGVRNFIVEKSLETELYPDANFIIAENVIDSFQNLIIQHRNKFADLEVIGITGSNGKTVVKEWLSILFSKFRHIVKTPKSFNSQIGVPLSVSQINENHTLAIFEAGISTVNEMERLSNIIQPTIGIITNIGNAHDNGFSDRNQKLKEKLKLFKDVRTLIYRYDSSLIKQEVEMTFPKSKLLSWGFHPDSDIYIESQKQINDEYELKLKYKGQNYDFAFSFSNEYYFENLMHCIATGLLLGLSKESIEKAIPMFDSLDMRLQITEGLNGGLIINDAYTNDLESLKVATAFLLKHAGKRKKHILLSEMENNNKNLNEEIIKHLNQIEDLNVTLVGNSWNEVEHQYNVINVEKESLEEYLNRNWEDTILLLKGARKFKFEEIFKKLMKLSHTVSLNIDLGAIAHNLSIYGSLLKGDTLLMPIIKASAYGAGSEEIAKLFQYKGIKKMGVAFADEAVYLRKSGITIPLVVLNADESSFQTIYEYNLELEIYSINHLLSFIKWNNGKMIGLNSIHLKLDTGMSRLGFRPEDLDELLSILKKYTLKIDSIFTHLSSSEDANDDEFTHLQASKFQYLYDKISSILGYLPNRHILNSSGIVRFPQYHYEIVRLGLGLYGIDVTNGIEDKLIKVHTLIARIIQIKNVLPGDFIGYNRRYKVEKPMKIGIINIGYADGLIRKCGNEKYKVMVNNNLVPIIGNVCMDLSIIDLTGIEASEGDEVIIFGKDLPIEDLAKVCDTIPYEILTRIAPRVKRNYIE